jgi:hypothetical protein
LGCDTVLYALYTWDVRSAVPKTHEALFGQLNHVRRIVMECGDFSPHSNDPCYKDLWVEVWLRGELEPFIMRQRFNKSNASPSSKQAFINDLAQRRIGDALLVLCGETNIAGTEDHSDHIKDPYKFAEHLREAGVRLVLNPVHDHMKRHEMLKKLRFYSLGGRTVISVWNKGNGREPKMLWTVFHDGDDRTAEVTEISPPVPERPDIRIGIVSIRSR